MPNEFNQCVRILVSVIGFSFFTLNGMSSAQTGETVAYCDSPQYAVNVFQKNSIPSSDPSLFIRIFWREKSLIFAELPARRSNSSDEGYTYTSQSGVSEDYSKSLWTLYVPQKEGQPCLVFRNGAAFTSGDVTKRE